ncbi:MAG: phosphoribosylformylglycinamidine cyclo-ligase [Phycisphaerales bacterium]|nr:phosphoribosylformylglycinamidine cyclo-ligase [Phycisphaerales bacterium]MBT7171371.1 phosphoribosylformylglycinamidine cyclo-ligase [Phycisphaerales bacterium]
MTESNSKSITYKDSGVDIDAGEEMVGRIKSMVKDTHIPGVLDNFGSFAGLFQLAKSNRTGRELKNPVLAACTDGVGTKLAVAFAMNKIDTVGIDLVAMSVNDLICGGAEPLIFLDYLAVGKLEPARMAEIVKGIADGCKASGCALIGGETAEMPSFYKPDEFDMAGFAVGIVDKDEIIEGQNAAAGDVILGIASDGIHSNGYGLARRVLLDGDNAPGKDACPPILDGQSIGEAMLVPTRLYVDPIMKLIGELHSDNARPIHAMAHITGGGIEGNIPRVLPDGLTVKIDRNSWPNLPLFELVARLGPVDQSEMFRVFNMGIGYAVVVSPEAADDALRILNEAGETCYRIGEVVAGDEVLWADEEE